MLEHSGSMNVGIDSVKSVFLDDFSDSQGALFISSLCCFDLLRRERFIISVGLIGFEESFQFLAERRLFGLVSSLRGFQQWSWPGYQHERQKRCRCAHEEPLQKGSR